MLIRRVSLQGQLKSTVLCSVCGHRSRTFDPFMYLTVPIPGANKRSVLFTFYPQDLRCAPSICLFESATRLVSTTAVSPAWNAGLECGPPCALGSDHHTSLSICFRPSPSMPIGKYKAVVPSDGNVKDFRDIASLLTGIEPRCVRTAARSTCRLVNRGIVPLSWHCCCLHGDGSFK